MRTAAILFALLAVVAMAAKESASNVVTFLPSGVVKAAFEKGMPLIEVDDYKIHASRREGPGMAEVHELDTDIVYVLEGSATLVTGGEAVDAKTTAPEEIRGTSIRGGDSREIQPGDVIVIPGGVPHLFQSVSAPLLYHVVKVRASEGGGR